MSIVVIGQVRTFSRAEHAERLVLWTIADNAGDDGVGYPPIQDRCPTCVYAYLDQDGICDKCGSQLDERERKSISCGTRLAEGTVREAIKALQLKGELQVAKAQRGRRQINVYRVTVGWLREIEPNYTDLPFKLKEPFPRLPSNSDGGHERDSASPLQDPNLSAAPRPPWNSDGSQGASISEGLPSEFGPDHRGNTDLTTVEIPAPTRAGVIGASREPSRESSDERQRTSLVPPTGGERARLVDQLKWELTAQLGCKPVTRSEHGHWGKAIAELVDAGADPDELRRRVVVYRRRWPGAALTPMALVRHWGFLGVAVEAKTDPHEAWLEQSSWQLPEPEDAHWIVDSWTDVDDDERQVLHDRVDSIRAERDEAAA